LGNFDGALYKEKVAKCFYCVEIAL